ncbi:hypothetical protein GDO86_009991 [Hymenochirus boettgeri]|uniref:3CxxC-type domain-containing protein n=1 Tax=Hymenochirus boettgeri TaxID=247094 RepID=A0A8T2JRL3_9PIPI|nr:hypothetical protein GDO86_009991 [Hymenochirus boettgeri]
MAALQVWKFIFHQISSRRTRQWTLNTYEDELTVNGWKSFIQHDALAEFHCQVCGNQWTSIHAVISFKMNKWDQKVNMKLLGQKCKHCENNFIRPTISEEIIRVILKNLINTIRKNIYGEVNVPRLNKANGGHIKHGTHKTWLCEACKMGICRHHVSLTIPESHTTSRDGYHAGTNNSCTEGCIGCICLLIVIVVLFVTRDLWANTLKAFFA